MRAEIAAISRILLITSRLFGQRRATAELGRRLVAVGHSVSVAGPGLARSDAEGAALNFSELPDYRLGGPDLPAARRLADLLPPRRGVRLGQAMEALGADEIRSVLVESRPDLVLIDSELHPHIVVARSLGLRTGLTTTIYRGPPGLRAPPLESGIVPGEGVGGSRAGVAAAWLAAWARSDLARLRDVRRGGGYRGLLAAFSRSEAVDLARETTTRHWQRPFSWHRLPLLVMQPLELDLPRPPDPRLRHIGHLAGAQRDATAMRGGNSHGQDGKRLAYVAFGSMVPAPQSLVEKLWQVARRFEDWNFVQALGGMPRNVLPSEPPDNVELVDWAPQRELLRRADVAIIHAGANSLVECVEAECPALCIPLGHDQEGNAARAVYHGVGRVARHDDSAGSIIQSLLRLADDPGYRARCASIRKKMERYGWDGVAEREVERLLPEPV